MNTNNDYINPQAPPFTEDEKKLWAILQEVCDPEIPVLSIVDLGIIREVRIENASTGSERPNVSITITPTYSGCPAMDVIAQDIETACGQHGFVHVKISSALSPAWTTDWMTEQGKEKLRAYGIAPPVGKSFSLRYLEDLHVECPQCHSGNTHLVSQFGSTACKALFKCDDCSEPFDYFKCH